MKRVSKVLKTVVFFRTEGWYPTYYPVNYQDWEAEAKRNPGTLRIEDVSGNVLWRKEKRSEAN